MILSKVCHVTTVHNYNDNRIFYKECRSLSEAGYDVYLVASVESDFVEQNISILGIGSFNTRKDRFFRGFYRAFKRIFRLKPDLVHIHDPELSLMIPILRLLGIKVIYDIHEDNKAFVLEKEYLPQLVRKPLAFFVGIWESFVAKISFTIIAEKYYSERFPAAVEVFNYPIVENVFLEEQPCLKLPADFDWFVFSGNVSIARGAIDNLQILVSDTNSGVCYLGRCSKETKILIDDFLRVNRVDPIRFLLIGLDEFIPHSYIQACLHKYNWRGGLAIIPDSDFNNRKLLTKFFDYMAADIPIICSDFPEWRRFVEDNNVGIVYSSKWKDELIHLEYKKGVRSSFTWSSEARKLLDLYQLALG